MLRQRRGFTMIELMVTLAVLVVITLLAVPSFQAIRQRAAVRNAAEQSLAFWNQARLEAAKRNTRVKVGIVQSNSGKTFCIGAGLATSATDTAPCDCTSTTACEVARFGNVQDDWSGATLTGSTVGKATAADTTATWPSNGPKAAVIDPKTGVLGSVFQAGYIEYTSPSGPRSYRLRMQVGQTGKASLCQPTGDANQMSDFNGRRC